VETSSGGPPNATACQQFRAKYGHEDVVTLFASSGQANVLWHNNYTALSVFMDKDRVITNKFNSDIKTQIVGEISKVLAP